MKLESALLLFALIIIAARTLKRENLKWAIVSLLNLALVLVLFFSDKYFHGIGLVALVSFHYVLLDFKKLHLIPIYALPLLTISAFKAFPIYALIGTSYLCFRMLSAASEMHAGRVGEFSFWQYLLYCFFLPTYKLGPIGTLQDHLESIPVQNNLRAFDLNWPQLARIGYGAVKFLVFTPAVTYYSHSLGYSNWKEVTTVGALIGTGFFTYIKIYLSFSGVNDVAIGLAHFLKFKMKENFLHPFRAKNVSEFWSNWHVSLTDLLKELIFIPLNIKLLKKFGRERKLIITPMIHFVLFIAIGLWHGIGWGFVLMGCAHAVVAITAWYFSLGMNKMWSGYRDSKVVSLLSVALTQTFIAVSFIFFECTVPEIRQIFLQIFQSGL